MSDEINRDRRRFLGAVGMTIAAAQFGIIDPAAAQSSKPSRATLPAIKPGTNKSFGSLKQTDVGVLNVGYAHCRHIQPYGGIHHESKPAVARRDTR